MHDLFLTHDSNILDNPFKFLLRFIHIVFLDRDKN